VGLAGLALAAGFLVAAGFLAAASFLAAAGFLTATGEQRAVSGDVLHVDRADNAEEEACWTIEYVSFFHD
jgi:hypothetical protein